MYEPIDLSKCQSQFDLTSINQLLAAIYRKIVFVVMVLHRFHPFHPLVVKLGLVRLSHFFACILYHYTSVQQTEAPKNGTKVRKQSNQVSK